ncbi:MAG: PH domain-containing protein [Clostridia bacterium]|nr:PH domain-containing protein [Clostridia bacterium]
METLYTVKKSIVPSFTILRILFFWLIIPVIFIICDILKYAKETVEIYDTCIKEKTGILSRNEKQITFAGVVSVSVNQSLFGRIFNYGTVTIDIVGKDNIYIESAKNPFELKKFLESKFIDSKNSTTNIIA